MIYVWFTGINRYILTFEKIVTLFLWQLWPYGNQALLTQTSQLSREVKSEIGDVDDTFVNVRGLKWHFVHYESWYFLMKYIAS
jgi:hypothetical protein